MMNQRKLWALLIITSLMMVGCVGQGEYDRMKTAWRKSQEQVLELQAQIDAKEAQIQAIRDAKPAENPDTLKALARAEAEKEILEAKLAELDAKLRDMSRQPGILPVELNNALENLAKSNPGLMTYDAEQGMVKFTSDLTFALGSVNLSDNAKAGLAKMANILKSTSGVNYDVRIVGHTDNVPINAVREQHPTNWHLSVHRAIAVKSELVKDGVPPVRVEVAGRGEFQPIVTNTSNGAAANRRVEIYLVPSRYEPPAAPEVTPMQEETPAEEEAPTETPAEDDVFK